jgi:hypothetical protein
MVRIHSIRVTGEVSLFMEGMAAVLMFKKYYNALVTNCTSTVHFPLSTCGLPALEFNYGTFHIP